MVRMMTMDEKLKQLDCHFNWNLLYNKKTRDEDFLGLIDFLTIDIENNPDSLFVGVPLIAYLYEINNNSEKALSILSSTIIKSKQEDFKAHRDGFMYLALAIKAFIAMNEKEEDAANIIEVIKELMPLSKSGKAFIHGARAYGLIMMGSDNYLDGLSFYRKAYRLDQTYYMWPMGVSNVCTRLRKIFEGGKSYPTEVEEVLMDRAIELSHGKKPIPLVFKAELLFNKGREFRFGIDKDEKLLKEAKLMFMKAMKLAPNCSHVLNRVGKAFSICAENEGDIDFAGDCLQKAADFHPKSSVSYHRLGQFYEHTAHDLEKAKVNYELAATVLRPERNLYADLDLGRIYKRLNPEFDTKKYYEDLKSRYPNNQLDLDKIEEAMRRQEEFDNRPAKTSSNKFQPRSGSRFIGRNNFRDNCRNESDRRFARDDGKWDERSRNKYIQREKPFIRNNSIERDWMDERKSRFALIDRRNKSEERDWKTDKEERNRFYPNGKFHLRNSSRESRGYSLREDSDEDSKEVKAEDKQEKKEVEERFKPRDDSRYRIRDRYDGYRKENERGEVGRYRRFSLEEQKDSELDLDDKTRLVREVEKFCKN